MHVLIITKSGGGADSLVASLRGEGHAVTVAAGSPDVARHIRELPLGAIIVESVHGSAAEEFRRRAQRVRPGCRVLFVSNLGAASDRGRLHPAGPGEMVVREQDLAALLADTPAPEPPAADDQKLRSLIQALDVVVSLIESDDPYFAGYSHRVSELAEEIAQRMQLGPGACEEVRIAALLHDIGKTALEPTILHEPGVLHEPAAMRMREHVHWGVRLLEHIEFPWRVLDIVRHHHERYDGSGYPDGLQGRAIPIGSRILAAVDAYVAMISHRRHRAALREDEAREELIRTSGTQLDPEVVELLLGIAAERSAPARGGSRPRVAVIDSDPVFQRLLRLRLTTEGFDLDAREAATDIEPLLRAGATSLLLVDSTADGVKAVEAARAAAEAAGVPQTPLAVLSAQDDRSVRRECLKLGVEDFIAKSEDLEDIVARIKGVLVRERRRSAPAAVPAQEGLAGSLATMDLPEIIQFLAMGQKSARIMLEAGGEDGDVWIASGRLIHARCGALTGRQALFAMLRWKDGRFRINHGVAAPAQTIEGDTMALVLDGLRLSDEASAGIDP